jgi:uncharacterized protein (DUF983 family)
MIYKSVHRKLKLQWPKDMGENDNDLQNYTQKRKERVKLTPLKYRGELGCYGRLGNSCCTCGTRLVIWHFHYLCNVFISLLFIFFISAVSLYTFRPYLSTYIWVFFSILFLIKLIYCIGGIRDIHSLWKKVIKGMLILW